MQSRSCEFKPQLGQHSFGHLSKVTGLTVYVEKQSFALEVFCVEYMYWCVEYMYWCVEYCGVLVCEVLVCGVLVCGVLVWESPKTH